MINRRLLLKATALGATLPWMHRAQALPEGAATSDLIYLTPIRSNGAESRCQAEIWFAALDDALYVVTSSDAWRARAIVDRGLTDTRIWVGDVGQWQDTDGKYRELPSLMATGSQVTDQAVQEAVLEVMGSKYRMSWLLWGPRFRNGLADGKRVMLKYSPKGSGVPQPPSIKM
jgi:hypothetical protein